MKRKLLVAALFLLSGCGPRVNPEELGTIDHNLPRLDLTEEKYPLPKLDDPAAAGPPADPPAGAATN